jgi:hypothetical protein
MSGPTSAPVGHEYPPSPSEGRTNGLPALAVVRFRHPSVEVALQLALPLSVDGLPPRIRWLLLLRLTHVSPLPSIVLTIPWRSMERR